MMRKEVYKIVLFYLILGLMFSCVKTKGRIQKDEWIGKEIHFPNALLQLKEGSHYPITSLEKELKGKKKIVSIIDATCRKCIIGQLNKIDSLFIPLLKSKEAEMIFVLNVNSADSMYFMTRMFPEVKVKGALLWDNGYHFETENDIFTEKVSRRTFLLNEQNRITQVGNPLLNKDLIKDYKEKFK